MSSNQHVLLIGGLRLVHDILRRQGGVRTTLMMHCDRILEKDRKVNQRIIAPATDRLEEWVALAEACHKVDPFDAVGAYHEHDQEKAAAISEQLGLKFHRTKTIHWVRNKVLMRERLRKMEVDALPMQRVHNVQEAILFSQQHGEVILKPQDGWASASVYRVHHQQPEGIEKAFLQHPDVQFMAEKLLVGDEYSVEAFSENGQHRVLCITAKYKDPNTFVELGHVLPAELGTTRQAEISTYVEKVLSALQIENGPTHTELIYTQEGPIIVETHTRFGGDFIPDLIHDALGINVMALTVRQTLQQSVWDELTPVPEIQQCAAIVFAVTPTTGKLIAVEGLEEALNAPQIKEVSLLKRVGDDLPGLRDSFDRLLYVRSTGESNLSALNHANFALQTLRVSIQTSLATVGM